jgi:hypothetical protein
MAAKVIIYLCIGNHYLALPITIKGIFSTNYQCFIDAFNTLLILLLNGAINNNLMTFDTYRIT